MFQASQRLTAMFCSTFGYASIRLGGYGSADEQFLRAHRINSRRIALRLALHDLRVMIRTRPLRKRGRYEASTERCQVVTKTSSRDVSIVVELVLSRTGVVPVVTFHVLMSDLNPQL
jgi:hypothetical protein